VIRSNFHLPFRFSVTVPVFGRVRRDTRSSLALRSLEAAARPAQRPAERFSNHNQLFFAIECKKSGKSFCMLIYHLVCK
jgi:hypothetical protein